ncbi:hypothetical protein GCM10010176_079460 [Nonomuraea spiralis]|nr:hypothetical protein GCM10010176_079460 [Nonomuraea spiralis]
MPGEEPPGPGGSPGPKPGLQLGAPLARARRRRDRLLTIPSFRLIVRRAAGHRLATTPFRYGVCHRNRWETGEIGGVWRTRGRQSAMISSVDKLELSLADSD